MVMDDDDDDDDDDGAFPFQAGRVHLGRKMSAFDWGSFCLSFFCQCRLTVFSSSIS